MDCPNLVTLSASGNNIEVFANNKLPSLTTLDLSAAVVTTLNDLSNNTIPNVRNLDLTNNAFDNISQITAFKYLENVKLDRNKFT